MKVPPNVEDLLRSHAPKVKRHKISVDYDEELKGFYFVSDGVSYPYTILDESSLYWYASGFLEALDG